MQPRDADRGGSQGLELRWESWVRCLLGTRAREKLSHCGPDLKSWGISCIYKNKGSVSRILAGEVLRQCSVRDWA